MTSLLTGRLSRREILPGENVVFSVDLDEPLDFKAGQYVRVILEDESLEKDERSRFLSIASAPSDSASLTFAMKMSGSRFKRYLTSVKKGARIYVEGPRGRFTIRKDEESPVIFITDSIGIPPVRGILEQASREKYDRRIYLFYLLDHRDRAMFMNDLSEFRRKNRKITIFRLHRNTGGGEFNQAASIKENVGEDFSRSVFYVCGPPYMVASMRRSLTSHGVNGSRIVMEGFSGY